MTYQKCLHITFHIVLSLIDRLLPICTLSSERTATTTTINGNVCRAIEHAFLKRLRVRWHHISLITLYTSAGLFDRGIIRKNYRPRVSELTEDKTKRFVTSSEFLGSLAQVSRGRIRHEPIRRFPSKLAPTVCNNG